MDLRGHDGSVTIWLTASQRKKVEAALKILEKHGAGALMYVEKS